MLDLFFPQSKMSQALSITARAVPARTSLPILECVLLEAKDGIISLTANDMEKAIRTVIPGKIVGEGKIALEAKLFSDMIRKMPDEEIHLKVGSNLQVEITSQGGAGNPKFIMPGKNGEDFIGLPAMEKGEAVHISQLTLKNIVEQTIFSTALNDNNKMMTGELFEIKGNVLRLAALDGHRIAIRYCILKEHYENKAVIIPGKTLSDISRIIGGDAGKEVEIYLGRNHIMFVIEETTMVSRLIEGEYFRIDQMITNNYETKISFNRREMIDCIERAMILVRESDKKPLIIDIKDSGVELTLTSIIGSMRETLSVEKEGKDLMIGFNPRFLSDALKAVEDERVSLFLTNSRAPGFIRDEQGTYIYLILPVNFVSR